MKKLVSMLVLLAVLLGSVAMAENLLPYAGEEVVYEGYTADLGIQEDKNSPVYKAWKEKLGNVSINWSTGPWADFDTKTAIYLNTGDLPDIVWLRNSPDVISNYGDLGYFLNFMDYLDYMPNLKSYLETYPQIANMKTEDGKLYCLNDIEPNDYVDESFFVNKTALDALGKDMKTYIDENIMYFIDGTRDMSEWDAFVEETLALGNMDEVLATYEAAEQVIYSTERRYVSYN